jgi:hypothetical protein
VFSAYGDADFGAASSSKCGKPARSISPLSVSVTAERLLYRSKAELENGDYSLSAIIAVMAVESFLTRLFLKLKGMEQYAAGFNFPTPAEEAQWEKEFPRSGGFPKPADFVTQNAMCMTFDEFVKGNSDASKIFSTLSETGSAGPTQYIQGELFKRRNRIVHWGYVNSNRSDAELCHAIAVATVSILREMDRSKYGKL